MDEKIPGLIRYSRSQCMQCKTISELKEYHGLDLTQNPAGKELLLKGSFPVALPQVRPGGGHRLALLVF